MSRQKSNKKSDRKLAQRQARWDLLRERSKDKTGYPMSHRKPGSRSGRK